MWVRSLRENNLAYHKPAKDYVWHFVQKAEFPMEARCARNIPLSNIFMSEEKPETNYIYSRCCRRLEDDARRRLKNADA